MNKKFLILAGIIILSIIGGFVAISTTSRPSPKNQAVPASGNTGTESSASQDPQDVIPGLYPDPIQNMATAPGFKISAIKVENNTDAAGNPVSDHLQLTLQNVTDKELTNFEVYYSITDTVTGKKEGYYKKLNAYVLSPKTSQSIHFDNKPGSSHFTANTHSLYFTSSNKLQFTVMVSTAGYRTESAQATKAAGGAETKD